MWENNTKWLHLSISIMESWQNLSWFVPSSISVRAALQWSGKGLAWTTWKIESPCRTGKAVNWCTSKLSTFERQKGSTKPWFWMNQAGIRTVHTIYLVLLLLLSLVVIIVIILLSLLSLWDIVISMFGSFPLTIIIVVCLVVFLLLSLLLI
jgi:hypothetical protein